MTLVGYKRYPSEVFREMYMQYKDELSDYPDSAERTTNALKSRDAVRLYLAEPGLGPVGLTLLQQTDTGGFPDKGPELYIAGFYVKPAYRRNGYGTEALLRIAEKYPGTNVYLHCVRENMTGNEFWSAAVRKCGLETVSGPDAAETDGYNLICFRTADIMKEPGCKALTLDEAASRMGISRTTMYRTYLYFSDFPKIRVGRRYIIPEKALDQWIQQKNQRF